MTVNEAYEVFIALYKISPKNHTGSQLGVPMQYVACLSDAERIALFNSLIAVAMQAEDGKLEININDKAAMVAAATAQLPAEREKQKQAQANFIANRSRNSVYDYNS